MYFEKFFVGQTFIIEPFAITREQIIDFAASYDPLPLHLDEEYAKTTRFGGLISSGVLSFMSLWVHLVEEHDPFGDDMVAGKSNHMEWFAPTYPNDELRGTVTVTKLTKRNNYNGIIEIEIDGWNQDDTHTLHGGAEVIVRTALARTGVKGNSPREP